MAAPTEAAGALRLRTAALAAGAVLLVLLALGATNAWRDLEKRGFDLLTVETAPYRSAFPITLVGIDEASFREVGRQWPWPRRLYAQLIDQLSRGGALVIGLDILIAEASNPEDDRLFAEAIRRCGCVILVADMAFQESAYSRQWMRVDPMPELLKAGATSGLANVTLDRDLVVRQMSEGRDVFWREIIRRANARQPGLIPEPASLASAMIRYAGPDHTFPYVSFYQALEADKLLPAEAFRDQIVLVGRDVKSSPDAGAANADTFATPFTGRSGWLTPGVELHANMLETAVGGRAVFPVPAPVPPLVVIVAIGAAALGLRRWRPLVGAVLVVVLAGALAASSWGLFQYADRWLPVGAAILGAVAVYIVYGAIAYLTERQRRAEVRRAFAMYVSPEVVEDMLAHPEKLRLGGERREVTALFTDLKGFTTLSEALGPDQVTNVVNEHFTRASAIAKRNGGTVTQFIGDAVMVIWNAPLDDPRHAARAAAAAQEMQEDIAAMRRELVARGLPEIFMRIGLHTGSAVVGNLGAADRFNYTALGDTINLASRLEGVNKLFGTGILMSGDTARGQEPGAPLRPVGRVIVKGKTEPVDIFTLEPDASVRQRTVEAMAAYRARDWAASEKAWREILVARPGDGLAAHYLEKIATLRGSELPAGWDGAETLEKL